ncbi:RNA deprotection pyrophosphohydrolase [Geomicrobium sp. JCM 19038]|uniref:RNA deprotection pyrophosphohydrolase n=1 Tax=Geomicrobium sp. JCM 19038 TaxID=1460635 RepID=UPI00045F1067|nr:nucleoside triphosphatase YtkD [Geomicrobium sp. JCM 19038]GAK10205.1 Nudix hydrolase YtkD [Geomicrobium sp. JCM 19038]
MYDFQDYYDNAVKLSFEREPFSIEPKHVWVICKFKDQWLLTKHSDRGLEFPGGKVEDGELPEMAAVREVWEETGARIHNLEYVGQYEVKGKTETVIKNIYFAEVATIEKKATYLETDGPVLKQQLPDTIRTDRSYSFIMKDDVLRYCLRRLDQ